jgi:hypothetical protein
MMGRTLHLGSAALILALALPAWGQAGNQGEADHSDADPTQPVVFSLREEYYDLLGDTWLNVFMLRSDRVFLKHKIGRPKGLVTRYELPLATVHAASEETSGLGDAYAQALFFPRLTRGFSFGLGPALVLPTATDERLGAGKWQFAPLTLPLWFHGNRGLFLVKFQDVFSFAGDDDRRDIHCLLVSPLWFRRLSGRSWIAVDGEARIDWEDGGRTSLKVGVQLGRAFGRRFGLAIKPEVPFGEHRAGDWTVKLFLLITH